MGMPSAQDLHALEARIAAIEAQLGGKTTPAKKTTAKSKTTAAKKK
jgi:BMFP domain-containing protein YqiC